jgi:hypothetical protein
MQLKYLEIHRKINTTPIKVKQFLLGSWFYDLSNKNIKNLYFYYNVLN